MRSDTNATLHCAHPKLNARPKCRLSSFRQLLFNLLSRLLNLSCATLALRILVIQRAYLFASETLVFVVVVAVVWILAIL